MIEDSRNHRGLLTMTLAGYRGPAIAGMLMVLGLAWWTTQEIQAVEARQRQELRRFVDGIMLALDASHDVLRRPRLDGPRGALDPLGPPHPRPGARGDRRPPPARRGDDLSALEPVLQRVTEGQPTVRSIAILSNGTVDVAAGDSLDRSLVSGHRGELVSDGHFISWRPLGARPRPGRDRSEPPDTPPAPPEGAPIAVIAVDATSPGEGRRQDALQIAQKIGAAAVAMAAFVAAWVLGIRSRSLTDRLQTEQIRREHLEELSLAASGLAHETKNPLGIIRGLAQNLEDRDGLATDEREAAGQILEEADRAVARLGEFMSYARIRDPELKPVDAARLVQRALTVLAADLESAGVSAGLEGPDITVLADEDMLLQILLNLLLNGLEASDSGGALTVRIAVDGGRATLAVADRGRGIDPGILPRLFKPYVTGRADGHGLGLATVKRMVDHHGWNITAHSRPGRGTTMTITGLAVVGDAGGEG
jgi:two-component system sensor histidine kinase HydH